MDAPERGALMLVRFIAAALLSWTIVEIALYWALCQHTNQPVEIFPILLKSVSGVIGIVVLMKARAIAEWVANKLDQ